MLAQCIGASPRQGEVYGCPHIPCSSIQIHLQRPCTIWCTLDVYFASQYISNSGPQAPLPGRYSVWNCYAAASSTGGKTHHNRLVPYLLQLRTVSPECFITYSPTGLGMQFPERWKVWNQMGGSEKGPCGRGSKCSIRNGFSLGCVTDLTLSLVFL